jgi:hypothetical protein
MEDEYIRRGLSIYSDLGDVPRRGVIPSCVIIDERV